MQMFAYTVPPMPHFALSQCVNAYYHYIATKYYILFIINSIWKSQMISIRKHNGNMHAGLKCSTVLRIDQMIFDNYVFKL